MNSFVENGLLPLIHQSTRVTESLGTVIDNIFCNNFDHETVSGNLLIKISDHLPQFPIVKKQAECYQSAEFYKHDYRNFDKDLFMDDSQFKIGQIWRMLTLIPMKSLITFYAE